MKLIKFTHSCVRIEDQDKVLVIDPGNFSETEQALAGADYLLVTHAHPDHFDPPRVLPLIAANPQLVIYAPEAVKETILAAVPTAQVFVPEADSEIDLDGFRVKTFGGQHALIHPLIRTIDNFGYLINERVYHPGDSLVVPHGLRVENLLVPLHAPWSKIQEVIDFVIAVGAQRAFPIHNALINENGHGIIEGQLKNFGSKYGTEYRHLEAGQSIEL